MLHSNARHGRCTVSRLHHSFYRQFVWKPVAFDFTLTRPCAEFTRPPEVAVARPVKLQTLLTGFFFTAISHIFTTISHFVDPYSNPYECWSSPFTSIPFPPYRIAWSEAVYLCPHPHKDTMCLPMVSPHNSSSGLPYGWHHGDTWFVNTTSPVGGPFPHHIGVPIVTTWYPNDMP